MLFLAYCRDGDCGPDLRREYQAQHLDWIASLGPRLQLAGPLRDAAGESVGSVLVVEAADLAEAEALLATDPYRQVGLWQRIELHAFMARAGRWLGAGAG